MTAPARIQRSRAKGWRMPPEAIYVGRPTLWGNPWGYGPRASILLHLNGGGSLYMCYRELMTRERAVTDFTLWVNLGFLNISQEHFTPTGLEMIRLGMDARRDEIHARLHELRGRDLVCWCPVDRRPCHAEVLLALANR